MKNGFKSHSKNLAFANLSSMDFYFAHQLAISKSQPFHSTFFCVHKRKRSGMYEKRPRCERSENYLKIRDVRIRDGRKRDERDLPVLTAELC